MSAGAINHNLMAANVANNLNSHYARLAVSTRRLSSGLRINSAADDAAGLAIRELMRSDIAAMSQGVRNANDAISMLQVADGALAVIDEKLIRMKELAEQAATGTYDSTQRLMIDSEYKAMADEIDRIARATNFNGIKLLDGSLSGVHDGGAMRAAGRLKIHFGSANDSAEDYYYVAIGDCTTKGLGLGQTGAWVKVEKEVDAPKGFKPQTSFIEYVDPDTNKKYYTDGNFFFTNAADPAGTALDEAADKDLIAKLVTIPDTTTHTTGYYVFVDPNGKEYYRSGRTYFTDPSNPWASELDDTDPANQALIASLKDTGERRKTSITYDIYENDEDFWYTSNGGLTFIYNISNPDEDKLDSQNPADKAIIDTLKPVMVAKKIPLPTVNERYYIYEDTRTSRRYFSMDGKNFVRYYTNPDNSKLDPVKDKDIINHLVAVPRFVRESTQFSIYDDPDTGKKYYSANGKDYVLDTDKPKDIALSVNNAADAAVIARLKVRLNKSSGEVKCLIFEDPKNNYKRYYSKDNGQTFFDDLSNPDNNVIDKNDPLVANFVKVNGTASMSLSYEEYMHDATRTKYYTRDGGKTFVLNKNRPDEIALDWNNSADQAMIQSLRGMHDLTTSTPIQYDVYLDNLNSRKYYTADGGKTFVSSTARPEATALDPSNPADKAILDRLRPDPTYNTRTIKKSFPEVYYLYEDSATKKIYYSADEGKTFVTRPLDPYSSQLDPADPASKAVIDRLQPVPGGKKTISIREYRENEGSVLTISTQQAAQEALATIKNAIVSKDKIRAHLGALQNRLENTVASLSIQAENLQVSESRISDMDVATEMTSFVRSQILTQSAVAMLGQANSFPHMLAMLINA